MSTLLDEARRLAEDRESNDLLSIARSMARQNEYNSMSYGDLPASKYRNGNIVEGLNGVKIDTTAPIGLQNIWQAPFDIGFGAAETANQTFFGGLGVGLAVGDKAVRNAAGDRYRENAGLYADPFYAEALQSAIPRTEEEKQKGEQIRNTPTAVTDAAKYMLYAYKGFNDWLDKKYREYVPNPNAVNEMFHGVGSTGGFIALSKVFPFLSSQLESLGNAGESLAKALEQGKFDEGIDAAIGQYGVDSVTNYLLDKMQSKIAGEYDEQTKQFSRGLLDRIQNKYLRGGLKMAANAGSEVAQETLQNTTGTAFDKNLEQDGGLKEYFGSLWNELGNIPQHFKDVAVPTTGSTLITEGLLGLLNRYGRYRHRRDWTNAREQQLRELREKQKASEELTAIASMPSEEQTEARSQALAEMRVRHAQEDMALNFRGQAEAEYDEFMRKAEEEAAKSDEQKEQERQERERQGQLNDYNTAVNRLDEEAAAEEAEKARVQSKLDAARAELAALQPENLNVPEKSVPEVQKTQEPVQNTQTRPTGSLMDITNSLDGMSELINQQRYIDQNRQDEAARQGEQRRYDEFLGGQNEFLRGMPVTQNTQTAAVANTANVNMPVNESENKPESLKAAAESAINTPVGTGTVKAQNDTMTVNKGRYTDINAFIKAATSPEGKKIGGSIYIDFDPIPDATADRVQQATGIDIHGYGHALDGSSVVHILNRHGENGTALKDFKNQVPLTPEDFALIPDVVANPDTIEATDNDRRILFKKRVDGHFIIVEETRNRYGKIIPVTAWKEKAAASPRTSETSPTTGSVSAMPPNINPEGHTSETDSQLSKVERPNAADLNKNISQASEGVKTGAVTADKNGAVSNLTTKTVTAEEDRQRKNTAKVRTARGTEIEVKYKIMELDDLIASNKPNGSPNPDYPQELQPRDRSRQASSDVNRIARNIDPELLGANRMASDGAPIIGTDRVVESGNGRVMAIRKSYFLGDAGNYVKWIKQHAAEFGLTNNDFNGIKQPVLVRERQGNIDRVKFVNEANEASISRMSQTEQAMSDAERITPEMLARYNPDKEVQNNKDFVNSFMFHIVGKNDMAELMTEDGELSQDGVQRIKNALMAKAYNDNKLMNRLRESLNNDIKNVTTGMLQASAKIAILENAAANGGAKPELSISKDITKAASVMAQLKKEDKKVGEYLAQLSMFSDADISKAAKKILKFFDDNSRAPRHIANMFARYAELAMNEGTAGQRSMFDLGRDKNTLLDEAIDYVENPDKYQDKNTVSENDEIETYSQNKAREIDEGQLEEVYGHKKTLQRLNEAGENDRNVRSVVIGLDKAAQDISELNDAIKNGDVNADLGLVDDVMQAASTLNDLRGEDYGLPVKWFLEHKDEFQGVELSDAAEQLLEFFDRNRGSGEIIAAGLSKYAELAMNNNKGLDKSELLKQAIQYTKSPDGYAKDRADDRAQSRLVENLTKAINDLHSPVISKDDAGVYAHFIANTYRYFARNLGISLDEATRMQGLEFVMGGKAGGNFLTQNIYEQIMYHGTRHNLGGRFDLLKIGTGEGMQMYGWGIYLAENREVSEYYRTAGESQVEKVSFTGENGEKFDFKKYDSAEEPISSAFKRLAFNEVMRELNMHPFSLQQDAQNELNDMRRKAEQAKSADDKAYWEKMAAKWEDISPVSVSMTANTGNLYTVDGPENDVLLDWDAPISKQPEKVKKTVNKIINFLKNQGFSQEILNDMLNSGANFYHGLSKITGTGKYRSKYAKNYQQHNSADRLASELLNNYGIPGLRYWDGDSRIKGDGTHNFVVWNTDLLKIMGVEGTATESEKYNQIGAKRKTEMDAQLKKRRPDLNDEQRTQTIAEIEKLGEDNPAKKSEKGNPKLEKAAFYWTLNDKRGIIRLPKDTHRIIQALKLCEKLHLQPEAIKNMNKFLEEHTADLPSVEGRIDPATVREFSKPQKMSKGVVVYTVEDSERGQEAVRKIVNTHWGKEAQPWCITETDDKGNLTSDAKDFWQNKYNKTEKRIAFKNGKLLAFSANQTSEVIWTDRLNRETKNIPSLEVTADDLFGDVTDFESENSTREDKALFDDLFGDSDTSETSPSQQYDLSDLFFSQGIKAEAKLAADEQAWSDRIDEYIEAEKSRQKIEEAKSRGEEIPKSERMDYCQ